MINVLFFSIAGTKQRDDIDEILFDLMSKDYILPDDKKTLEYTLETAKQGSYPSVDYYAEFYQDTQRIRSIAEIKNYAIKVRDFYNKESMIRSVMSIINEANTSTSLLDGISLLCERGTGEVEDYSAFGVKTYEDMGERPENVGFVTGITEIDQCTNGFQPGTTGSICAFVSEGKSTTWVSAIYKNIKQDKRGILFSLEMHPDIVWLQFQSRFLYEEHGIEIRAQELINRTLTDEKKKLVAQYDEEFRELMNNSLIILDESVLNKKILTNPRLLTSLLRSVEAKLGRLDFVIWDHANQFDLMYPDSGNMIIRAITSTCKTYKNSSGLPFFNGLAVQTNREGWKRAKKKDGKYDIAAISDLNEIERSSTYVLFLFTSEDMRMQQETKVTLAKNRLGQLLIEPSVTTFNPSVMVVGDIADTVEYNDDFTDIAKGDFGGFDDDF